MPFTPLHLGPALLLGLLLFRYLDLPTFLLANVILDIEPLTILAFDLDLPLHGFFHSFLGGTIASLLLGVAMLRTGDYLLPLMRTLHLEQIRDAKSILPASMVGAYLHIFLDSRLYADISPFYPYGFNPFFVSMTHRLYALEYLSYIASGIAGVVLVLFKFRRR